MVLLLLVEQNFRVKMLDQKHSVVVFFLFVKIWFSVVFLFLFCSILFLYSIANIEFSFVDLLSL